MTVVVPSCLAALPCFAKHYLGVLHRIRSCGLPVEISVKLTQLGLDLDPDFCLPNLTALMAYAPSSRNDVD